MRKIVLEGPNADTVTIEGKVYLYFGGTNYLGMSARREVAKGAMRAIDSFGLSSSASRTSTGTNTLHLALEAALGRFAGTEDAVVLSCGYLAMQTLLEGIVQTDDLLLLQRSAHPSIRQAARLTGLSCREFDLEDLDAFNFKTAAKGNQRVLIAAEGVSPLTGMVLPLPEILSLLKGCDFRILIDDAHGLGVAGVHGKGTAEYHGCTSSHILACGTLSKAFGAFGGCVLANQEVSENIRNHSLAYICASPPSAADLGAALTAVQLVTTQPKIIRHLHENAILLKRGLRQMGFPIEENHIPIVPIHLDTARQVIGLSERLFASGILAPYLSYPGSPKGGLIRLAVTAAHTSDQINRLLASLKQLL